MTSELPIIVPSRGERPEAPQFDINALASQAGGRFRLCSLITKRARELMSGATKLTDLKAKSPITLALKEFDSQKLELLTPEEAKRRLLGGGSDNEEEPKAS